MTEDELEAVKALQEYRDRLNHFRFGDNRIDEYPSGVDPVPTVQGEVEPVPEQVPLEAIPVVKLPPMRGFLERCGHRSDYPVPLQYVYPFRTGVLRVSSSTPVQAPDQLD